MSKVKKRSPKQRKFLKMGNSKNMIIKSKKESVIAAVYCCKKDLRIFATGAINLRESICNFCVTLDMLAA